MHILALLLPAQLLINCILHHKSITWVSNIDKSKRWKRTTLLPTRLCPEHRAPFACLGHFIHRSLQNSNITQIPIATL